MLDCNYCGREIDLSELELKTKFAIGDLDEKTGEPEESSFVQTNAICDCGHSNAYELTCEEANA